LAAVAAQLLVVGGLLLVMVASGGGLLTLVAGTALGLAVVVAAAWWAFTTRRIWKRPLNLVPAGLVAATTLFGWVVVGLQGAAGVLLVTVGVAGYAAAARRALEAAQAPPPSVPSGSGSTPDRPWLLVNPGSGGGKARRFGLASAARARGVQVHELAPGDDPQALARQAVAAGADAIGVAGGDGSLGPVAAVAVESDLPFVCVPAGTRNHFAADLGLDRAAPLAALDAFAGPERRVDVGAVGDRVFVNNVSLGAYAELVAEPGYRSGRLTTAHAVLPGALRGERPLLQVDFQDPQGRRYQDVAGLAARIAVRQGSAGSRWAQWMTTALRVDAAVAGLPAGVDGEAVTLAPPLQFRVLPLALRVRLPPALRPRAARLGPYGWPTVKRLWAAAGGRGISELELHHLGPGCWGPAADAPSDH
jgi:hypothetical protein